MTGEDTKESPHEPHGEKVPQQPLLQETRPQMGGGDQHDDHAVVNAAHTEELHRDQDLESDTESDAVEHQNGNDSDDPSDDCKTDGNDKWEEMFNRLVEYKKKFGNCLVPNRFPEDPRLGSWGKCAKYVFCDETISIAIVRYYNLLLPKLPLRGASSKSALSHRICLGIPKVERFEESIVSTRSDSRGEQLTLVMYPGSIVSAS